jgi:fibronectin type 3 domain-containing protein
MAISFIVVGLFIVFLILFIIYKLVLCPQTPSNVQCDWQDARVVITWDPQSRNATYQIFYRTKNNSNARWCILPDLYINTYALSIVNGISYEIEVKAKNSFGTSWLANTVSGCSRAPAPENLSVSHSANKSDSISLRWAMVTNCNGYIIKRTTCLENGIFTYMKRIDDSMITNFEDTSFTFGIKYYYKVVSMDRAGESSQPNLVSVLPRAPPPSDLIVSYDECMVNCIKLQWKPVLNCHGYAIQRGAKPFSSDEQTCIKQIRNSTVNSTEDTSFIFGLTYYYVVVSLDQAGESNRSNIASICPRAPASNDLVASYDENGGSFISLHWEPVPNCEGYIMKKLKSSFRGMLIIQTFDVSSDTRMNDASLTFGITYYYHVVSVDRAGESKRSNQVKVCPRAPSPKDLTVSYDQDKCTSIIIQWKPVTNCEGYVVQRMMDRSHDKVTTIKRLNSSSVTKTVDTSFTFGVVYTYTVVSLDQIGESGRSKLVSVCPRVPAAKGLAISFDDQTNSSINLSWEPVKNCKCYIVRRAENTSTGSYSTISRLCSPLETKITDNMFTFGIRYYYIVLSVDQAGESAESKVVSIFPRAPPPSNVIVSFENQDDYFILLQWEPLSSAQGYIIKRMSDDPDEFITTRRVKNSSITSIEDRCFTFGVTYRYIVTSLDQAGESDRSTEVSLCSRIPPPKNLTVITPKDVSGTIVIEWTSMPKSNGYCIYRAQTSDFIKETVVGKCS